MGEVRWGIMGTGKISSRFVEDLAQADGAVLEAVGSRTLDRAEAFAEAFGVPKAYGSYEELAGDGSLDVVYVGTPHIVHCDNMLLCIEAGLPVLCEKPFTMNAYEAARVVQAAREREVFVMEAMWTRFVPVVRRVRELIEAGVIGAPRVFIASLGQPPTETVAPYLRSLEDGGGLLLDAAVYPISLAYHLLGVPDAVTGTAQFHTSGVDDQEAIQLSYEDGRLASITATLRAAIPPAFGIYGESGAIVVEPPLFAPERATLFTDGREPERIELPRLGRGYVHEIAEVIRLLALGRLESDVMPLDESLAIMRTLDDLRSQWGLVYPFEAEARR